MRSDKIASCLLSASVLCAGSLAVTNAAADQTAAPSFEAQLAKVAAETGSWPRLKDLPEQQRRDALIFTVGNMLYAVFHEMGHAVISEMQLPVVGREEDAADSFAIVAGIEIMTNVSERALIEAGKGWFLSELSDRKHGAMAAFYDRHGMNLQRAYQIVCFMVGANPEKFGSLAKATNLPAARQEACQHDFAVTAWSWHTLLRPHLRKPDQPKTTIAVDYFEAKGDLDVYARSFRQLQFLERIADMASDRYVWRGPFSLQMETCGKVNAYWSVKERRVQICYELIDSYVQLYLDFVNDPKVAARLQALSPPAPMK